MQKLAFVGAGQMGRPMVSRLLDAGHSLTVYARRHEVRDEVDRAGAMVTSDLREAVQDSDAVLLCLYSDSQVRDICLGPAGALAFMNDEATLIVHTTGSPTTMRELAAEGAPKHVGVVDAPISGSALDIESGQLTVLLGGDPNDVSRVSEIVSAYADPVIIVGPLGSATTLKLLNNALFAAQVQLVAEVERIGAHFDLDATSVAQAIQHCSGRSYAMALLERTGSIAHLTETAGPFLRKDVDVMTRVTDEFGIDLGMLTEVIQRGPLDFS